VKLAGLDKKKPNQIGAIHGLPLHSFTYRERDKKRTYSALSAHFGSILFFFLKSARLARRGLFGAPDDKIPIPSSSAPSIPERHSCPPHKRRENDFPFSFLHPLILTTPPGSGKHGSGFMANGKGERIPAGIVSSHWGKLKAIRE
jgi:hypothetical protein